MLKQAVRYTDFDDNEAIETLYFNLTKTELTENLDMKDELEQISADLQGKERDLTEDEIRQILEFVKKLMRLSYGVRSQDGKRFIKSEEQWVEFTQTAVYDAFLFSLFKDPNMAVTFMSGIMPKELREAALEAVKHTDGLDPTAVNAALGDLGTKAPAASAPQTIPSVVDLPQTQAPNQAAAAPAGPPKLSDPPTPEEMAALAEWAKTQN